MKNNYCQQRKQKGLHLFYNNENELLKLKNTKILEYQELRKLKIGNNKIELVLYELPKNTEIIECFLEFCKNLK